MPSFYSLVDMERKSTIYMGNSQMLTDPSWKVKVRKTIPSVNAIILQPCVHGKK